MIQLHNEGYMTLRPDPQGLSAARGRIRELVRRLQLPEDEAAGILIAVGEAISNAYRHGTRNPDRDLIRLSWQHTVTDLVVTVKDDGKGLSRGSRQRTWAHPNSLAHGIEMMRAGTDEVRFFYDRGTKVVLRKRVRIMHEAIS